MNIRYKAKDQGGNWVEGYYAQLHVPEFDNHNAPQGYGISHELFNDEPGNRQDSYWTTIDINTLCISIGKKDKHGKMIFTNDLVRLNNLRYERTVLGMVVYDSDKAMFRCLASSDTMESKMPDNLSGYDPMVSLDGDIWEIEIIGNYCDGEH